MQSNYANPTRALRFFDLVACPQCTFPATRIPNADARATVPRVYTKSVLTTGRKKESNDPRALERSSRDRISARQSRRFISRSCSSPRATFIQTIPRHAESPLGRGITENCVAERAAPENSGFNCTFISPREIPAGTTSREAAASRRWSVDRGARVFGLDNRLRVCLMYRSEDTRRRGRVNVSS